MKLVALICSVFAVTSSTVNAILFSISLFSITAAYSCSLGASYSGLTYVILYAGAIGILFLFVISSLFPAISSSERETGQSQGNAGTPLALMLITSFWASDNNYINTDPYSTSPALGTLYPFQPNSIDNIALYLYCPNAIFLSVLGVLFLVASTGSLVLCLRD